MEVNGKVHPEYDSTIFKYGPTEYRERDGTLNCSYCGSMSPTDAIRLLKDPKCQASGSDWKYGWPHKFYIRVEKIGIKFYSKHLYDAIPSEYKELTDLLATKLGIRFVIDDKGLKYAAPYYGFQSWFGGGFDEQAPKIPEDM